MAKAISNSIYGRLALRPTSLVTKWREVAPYEMYESGFHQRYKAYNNIVLFEEESARVGLATQNNIAWASLITAIGRSEIMLLVSKCEQEGVGVSKIATDCVFTERPGSFIIDGKLFS